MTWWWVIFPLLVTHGSHRSDSVWRVRSQYGLVSGAVVFEARDLRVYGRHDEGYSLKKVSERFNITADGEPCALEGAQVSQLGSRLRFAASWLCKDNAEDYLIEMTGLDLLDPSHKHRAKIDDGKKITTQTMTPGNARMSFSEKPPPVPKTLFEFWQRQVKALPPQAQEQSKIPLSWLGFTAWGMVLFIVLAALVWRGRKRPVALVDAGSPAESDAASDESMAD